MKEKLLAELQSAQEQFQAAAARLAAIRPGPETSPDQIRDARDARKRAYDALILATKRWEDSNSKAAQAEAGG